MNNLSLSVCLIVKDNSGYLDYALDRLKEIASEIIVVLSPLTPLSEREGNKMDSLQVPSSVSPSFGSAQLPPLNDRTLSEVEELGVRVFNLPWNDDYSAVRNFALEKATQDWILIFDSEFILSVDKDELN